MGGSVCDGFGARATTGFCSRHSITPMSALFRLRIPDARMPDDAITHCVNRGVVGFGRLPPREQMSDVEWNAWLAGTNDQGHHPMAVTSVSGWRWLYTYVSV